MKDDSTQNADGFRVTVKARMYHGVLHETMVRLGKSRKEMAEYLGIHYSQFSDLLRMKWIPNLKTERGKILKQNLEDLTGMSVSKLFPRHIFTEEFLGSNKTIEVTREVPQHLLENAGMVHQLSLPPDEELMNKEEAGTDLATILEPVLKTLTERQRLIIQLRFLEGKSVTECMTILKIRHRASVGQLVAKAISRLQEPMRMRMISELSQNGHLVSSTEREFNNWLGRAIASNANVFEVKPR